MACPCSRPGFVERTAKRLIEGHGWSEAMAFAWARSLAKEEDIDDDDDTDTDSDGGEP
jgi:hypothetical protein